MLATLARLRRRYALPDPAALEAVARERREHPTRAERALTGFLNELNGHALEGRFEREWVCGDRWIVDFYFPEVRLALEVDGGYHRSTFQLGWDLFKAAELEGAGLTVVRLTNQEVLGDRARLVAKLRQAWRTAARAARPQPGSDGRQDVDRAARDQVFRLRPVRRHVGRGGVGLERVHTLPLLHDDEGVRPVAGLEAEGVLGVDRGAVLDAARLGEDVGDVRPERREN
jgi:very-short-patch-repair endonuclease